MMTTCVDYRYAQVTYENLVSMCVWLICFFEGSQSIIQVIEVQYRLNGYIKIYCIDGCVRTKVKTELVLNSNTNFNFDYLWTGLHRNWFGWCVLILQLTISNARILKLHGFCQVIDVVAESRWEKEKSTTSVK